MSDIFDPAENVAGGVKYSGTYSTAMTATHNSPWRLTTRGNSRGASSGHSSYPETEDYVSRVSRFYAVSGRSASSEQAEDDASNAIRLRIVVYVDPSGLIRFETESK